MLNNATRRRTLGALPWNPVAGGGVCFFCRKAFARSPDHLPGPAVGCAVRLAVGIGRQEPDPQVLEVVRLAAETRSVAALASLLEQVARRIHSQGYAFDLFPAQWAALRYLETAPPHMRTSIDLARFQGLASGAVARTVRTLIGKGLLVKAGTIGRGRAEQLDLTDLGRRMLAGDPLHKIAKALIVLTTAERESLAHGLEIAIRATMPDTSAA